MAPLQAMLQVPSRHENNKNIFRIFNGITYKAELRNVASFLYSQRNTEVKFKELLQLGAEDTESRQIEEIFGNGRSGKPELLYTQSLLPDENRVDWTLKDPVAGSDGSSAYFRVRIRKPVEEAADLMAYTNAIRIVTR